MARRSETLPDSTSGGPAASTTVDGRQRSSSSRKREAFDGDVKPAVDRSPGALAAESDELSISDLSVTARLGRPTGPC